MPDFQLVSDFRPMGDQPEAIRKLVGGIQEGHKHQTLLGATGTGKSLGYHDPVFIVEQRGTEQIARVMPIGELIDALIAQHPDRVQQQGETSVLDTQGGAVKYLAQAFNPTTCVVELYPISAVTRHAAPATMYRVRTGCGRRATLTGDHNLWVLRGGHLQLIKTAEARSTDYLPVPETLLVEGARTTLDTLALPTGQPLFVRAAEAILAYASEHGSMTLTSVMDTHGLSGYHKMWQIGRQTNRGSISVALLQDLLTQTDNLGGHWNPATAQVGGRHGRNVLPAQLDLTPEFLQLLGYYIAEGNCQAQDGYFILANYDVTIRQRIERALIQLNIPFTARPSSDYQVSSTALAAVLGGSCGTTARSKRLPAFWPQLANSALAHLLQAYFDGDGTVERASAVTATTASEQLASDVVYALLRFGIWGRIARVWKRAVATNHQGDWYYRITISGQADLRRFSDQIGFSLEYKQQRLLALLVHQDHSNVDLVPLDGAQLQALRQGVGLFQRELANLAGCSVSAKGKAGGIRAIEAGRRRPQRKNLKRILAALHQVALAKGVDEGWWESWGELMALCQLRWTPVAAVEPSDYALPFVYDFTVPGAETFLAGQGGFFIHNTYVMGQVIQQFNRPTLVLAHNKTLAAQLYSEFKEFFPSNAVEYFVSYYDYYQPEAYIARTDTYIEKDSDINEEIDKLRHAATRALFERRDVIIVASVSCIFGLGSPEEYGKVVVDLQKGQVARRDRVLRRLVDIQYDRNDMNLVRGTFRVRGDTLEVYPAYENIAVRIEFWGDEVERITEFDPLTGEVLVERNRIDIYPARHFITSEEKLTAAIVDIEVELDERLKELRAGEQLVEAQRLEQRTRYDLEMLQETGYCSGVENYSRHLSRRQAGERPATLLDYFPDDYLLFVDESHISLPQVRGMWGGDASRKQELIRYGFRLPSAADNRPLTWAEFERQIHQAVYVSATPGPYEYEHSAQLVEQIIRPTGLLDPEIEIKPTGGQVEDLVEQVRARTEKGQRTLVTTLTKRMAEDLADYMKEVGIKTHYLHSEIDTLERIEILRDLRLGVYDVIVGINLLREGLDLPEVSLVAILDADKEGFLRSRDSLIQTSGRAARHVEGKVIMYADRVTASMQAAIDETYRRREKQMRYNTEHNIEPATIVKQIRDLTERLRAVAETSPAYKASPSGEIAIPKEDRVRLVKELESQMKLAAKALEFEKAALLRDQIMELRRSLA